MHRAGITCGSCKTVMKNRRGPLRVGRARSSTGASASTSRSPGRSSSTSSRCTATGASTTSSRRHGTRPRLRHLQARVASILASQLNDHVLEPATGTLQDTNDAYLANIQRNGTYSVVPRIPGGEITPDKLIVIGEVARDFGLYTKITGGQRIDLFGARMEQLPEIWRRLVDAGFESGHAYGKSLRTVKSCVGSTWCRYGVQDSVSSRSTSSCATGACARRTSSRAASAAAPASAPRRAARTSA